MEHRLAARLDKIQESSTLRMARLARQLREQGVEIINLSLGEPDFDTPGHIKEAAIKAIEDGVTHYPPVAGFPELRKAIAQYYSNQYGGSYSAANVVVGTGAKQAIMNVILSIVDAGDEVVLPAPYWVSYPEMVKFADGLLRVISSTVEDEYKITPEELEGAITPHTRLVVLCSPGNPTGSVYNRREMDALVEVLERHKHVYVLSDEIYEHINFTGGHVSLAGYSSLADRAIIINGVSKSFAMTGWRIGYAIAPEPIAKACEKLQGQFTSGAAGISQMAALEALTAGLGPTEEMRKAFHRRREVALEYLSKIPQVKCNVPEGAFYLFPDVSALLGSTTPKGHTISTSEDLCMYLLEEAGVSLVGGEGFGASGCIRISYSASEADLRQGMEKISEAIRQLKPAKVNA